jgi:transcriptional regulator with XRE-family HTH domain
VLLREALAASHCNQSGFAGDLGVSQQAVSGWLCGRCKPSLSLMIRIEERFAIAVATWAERAPRGAARRAA